MIKRLPTILIAFAVGVVFASAVTSAGAPPPPLAWAATVSDLRLLSADPALPIPLLSAIIRDAVTDEDALAAVVAHYERNRVKLAAVFAEDNDERTRALYGMMIVHLAAPYNAVTRDWIGESFLAFVHGETAHCGAYAQAQRAVYTALGLRWRSVVVDNGWHELVEAEISGHFEIFDSTSAVWVSEPVERLLQGVERHYRTYYTPILDANADDVYRAHLEAGYSVPELRAGLPLWGLQIFPRTVVISAESML